MVEMSKNLTFLDRVSRIGFVIHDLKTSECERMLSRLRSKDEAFNAKLCLVPLTLAFKSREKIIIFLGEDCFCFPKTTRIMSGYLTYIRSEYIIDYSSKIRTCLTNKWNCFLRPVFTCARCDHSSSSKASELLVKRKLHQFHRHG